MVCFVYSDAIKANGAHEIMHIISINLWGNSESWIKEGLAVFSDDNWHGYNLHRLSKYLMSKKKLIPLKDLMRKFNSYNNLITYPEAGSFVKFIYEEYGGDIVKAIWKKGRNAIPEIIGEDLKTIEQKWHEILNKYDITDIEYELKT